MSISLKLSDDLVEMARYHAVVKQRSIPKQIEYWARLGKAVEDNPDLPIDFIQGTLLAKEEVKLGYISEYSFNKP